MLPFLCAMPDGNLDPGQLLVDEFLLAEEGRLRVYWSAKCASKHH